MDLHHILHRRTWHKGEKRVVLVLLSGSRILTADRIERTARVRRSTVDMVLMLLESYEMLGHTQLGHYWLTEMGRPFCLQLMGLD